jgi:hypothetical protein
MDSWKVLDFGWSCSSITVDPLQGKPMLAQVDACVFFTTALRLILGSCGRNSYNEDWIARL